MAQEVTQKSKESIQKYLTRKGSNYEDLDFLERYTIKEYFSKKFGTHLEKGLTEQEATRNRNLYGDNHLRKKKLKGFCDFFYNAITDDMLLILIAAAIISIVLEAIYSQQRSTFWIEGVSILVAVAVCSLVASINDFQKQKQFEQLNNIEQQSNLYDVIRGGVRKQLSRQDIVVGDLIMLNAGMQIPADGLVVEAINLILDESSITGESHQLYKDINQKCIRQKNISPCPSAVLLSGSKVMSGEGKMLSIVVGDDSQSGKLHQLIHEHDTNEQTPLEEKLEEMGDKIGKFGLYAAIIIFIVLLIRLVFNKIIPLGWNTSRDLQEIFRDLIIAVSIVVVAVPQGLPLAVTLSLAFSVKKMLDQNNLVRKLASCETMGGANFICTDKTGTLTKNEMSVVHLWSGNNHQFPNGNYSNFKLSDKYKHYLFNSIYHNSTAHLRPSERGAQTQIALLKFCQSLDKTQSCQKYRERVEEQGYFLRLPFNSDRKRMTTGVQVDRSNLVLMKGASEIIISACHNIMKPDGSIDSLNQAALLKELQNLTSKGLRTVAIAFKEVDQPASPHYRKRDKLGIQEIQRGDFTLLCVVGIQDLPRPQTAQALKACKEAGINVIMVTGDNKITAKAIARDVGILKSGQQNDRQCCMEGIEFEQLLKQHEIGGNQVNMLMENPLNKVFQKLKVISRSRPEHKYMLVEALKNLGHVVAVTGDGTNDAPALLKADVGFAMGKGGTQVAKNASDIIILDDNFKSIVRAIVWGRNIYDSIRKFLQFQLTTNVVAVGLSFISAVLIIQSVLTAVQMLWVNLIMDSLASLALSTQPPNDVQLLGRKPHSRRQSLISSRMIKHIIGQSIFQLTLMVLMLFWGHTFIPQYVDEFDNRIGKNLLAKYNNGLIGGTVVNGCFYNINGSQAYQKYFDEYHVYTRHFTFIFNTFVLMQIFNFFTCRRIHDQLNIFEGITKNWIFNAILILIIALQVIIVEVVNVPFKLYSYGGLTIQQWGLSILISLSVIPVSILLRLIPYGKQATEEAPQQSQQDDLNSKRSKSLRNKSRKQSYDIKSVGRQSLGRQSLGRQSNQNAGQNLNPNSRR